VEGRGSWNGKKRPPYKDFQMIMFLAPKLRIAGRPRQGAKETYALLEEPGEPVLVHWASKLMPHLKRNCPYCNGEEPKPIWYLGSLEVDSKEMVILELTWKCFRTLAPAAQIPNQEVDLFGDLIPAHSYLGLLVRISRGNFARSPRVLRCEQRLKKYPAWPYNTRAELARIWGIVTKPRIFREAGA
jgi:hypothetical protein